MNIYTGDFVRVYSQCGTLLFEGYLESFHPWKSSDGAWLKFYGIDGQRYCGIFFAWDKIEVDIPIKL